MKTLFTMMLVLAATNAVACVGAPLDEEEEAAEATNAPSESKAGDVKAETTNAACTAAELAACRKADPYGSGCIIENGHPLCLFE